MNRLKNVQKKYKKPLTVPLKSEIIAIHTVNTNYKHMRTKVLLGAAALAAGALTSMAQVYSANIVGYVNVTVNPGYQFLSNPLDATPDNKAGSVFPNSTGAYDGTSIQEWTGAGWTVSVFDSVTDDTTTGFTDPGGNPVPAPVLTSGKGFLFNYFPNTSATATFVGQVRTGTNSLALPQRGTPYAVGSMLPLSGGVASGLGLSNPTGVLDGDQVEILKVAPNGGAAGYTVSVYDSVTDDTTTGFTDPGGNPVPEPNIPMSGGFFFVNGFSGAYSWQQVLNP